MFRMLHFLTLLLFVSSFVFGCDAGKAPSSPSGPPLPPNGVIGTVLFSDDEVRTPVHAYHAWMGTEVLFLIVPDFKQAGGSAGGGGNGYEARLHGNIVLPNGMTQLTFQAETVNGKVESVTIADQMYDLKAGRLFFVSADGGIRVKQLDYETRNLKPTPPNSNEIEAFLTGIPELNEFSTKPGNAK